MEGLVDHDLVKSSDNTIRDINKKVILYTGSLNIQFGIMDLLDAIDLIANYNYEFWICGSGEAEKEIEKRCAHDKRIKYFGYVAKNEILKLQQKATVLINPRNNEGEYTKYSFPSKTMEYLMSGKPVIMYKLDGIPDEYDPFLYYITGNSPRDIANKIIEVAGKSQAELDVCGNRARQFVMKNKNHIVQARKILSLCSS
jgi:glycosyltransferase involved in cell wall biosynthesis